ncbi:COPZ2 [Scenedesmus sp. PABB004]|nr:COPZ2 [Scenedesmus sp. PABB004]
MAFDPTCPSVRSLIVLDSEGRRIAVKYFSPEWCGAAARRRRNGAAATAAAARARAPPHAAPHRRPAAARATVSAQANYEKAVFAKTSRTNARGEAEIVMFDDHLVVYKCLGDLMFYVTGGLEENELVLYAVLQAFYEATSTLLRQQVDKKTVLENLDLLLLVMDEIVDGGLILETDPQTVAARVTMRGADGEVPIAEQTFSQAFASAKEHLARSLLNPCGARRAALLCGGGAAAAMAAAPSTSLLDAYLTATSAPGGPAHAPPATPPPGDAGGAREARRDCAALRGVHAALDAALASSAGGGGGAPRSPRAATQPRSGGAARSPAGGLFREMREADAAAAAAERLARERDELLQQQPALLGRDGRGAAVRAIAGHAALAAKLQRLQADLDARSARQELLAQLQRPATLFDSGQPAPAAGPWGGGGASRQRAGGAPPRPGTSPALLGAAPAPAAPLPAQQQAGAQLPHIRALAECELPWRGERGGGPAGGAAGWPRGGPGAAAPQHHQQPRRPWTSGGRPAGARSSGGGGGGDFSARLAQMQEAAARQRASAGGARPAHARQQPLAQRPRQQQPQRLPSAVAAVEQSLSELAQLRSKYAQVQAAAQPPRQAQQRRQLPPQAQPGGRAAPGGGGDRAAAWQPQRPPRCRTWLPEPDLAHLAASPRAEVPGAAFSAVAWADSLPAARLPSPARRPRPGLDAPGLPAAWGAWQGQVHAAAATAGGAQAGRPRSRSAPRSLRAWDLLPLPHSAAPPRGRAGSPTRLAGALQACRGAQEQQRPRTAGGALERLAQSYRAAAAAPLQPCDLNVASVTPRGGSAWLASSPLKHVQGGATPGAAARALATAGSPTRVRAARLGAAAGAPASAPASPARGQGGAAAAAAVQMLQQLQACGGGASAGRERQRSPTRAYADRLAAAAHGARGAAGAGQLTARVLEFAAGRVASPQARRRRRRRASDGASSSSSSSSQATGDGSRSDGAARGRGRGALTPQAAYAAALGRVRAASRAERHRRRRSTGGGSGSSSDA